MGGEQGENDASCTPKSAASFGAGIVMGTVNTLVMKVMFETQSVGTDGKSTKFEKPMFLAFIMFSGMFFSVPTYFIHQRWLGKKDRISLRTYFLLAIPASFDLLGTMLSQIGLLYVTPSLYMLIRCFVIVVTAILKVTVLKTRLAKHEWLGVFINFLAMCLVSAPSFFAPMSSSGRDPRIGILFIVLSCLIQGAQYVFEEKVMANDGAPALIVVGMEGLWGVIISLAICWPIFYLIPGSDKGSMENMWDAVVMLHNSSLLTGYLLLYLFSVSLYNVFAVFITNLLNSVWHAILDNFRPVAVWATDLIIYYVFTKGKYGENWAWPGSYLQLFGMLILFFGTAVYNGSIPALRWEMEKEADEDDGEGGAIKKKERIFTPAFREMTSFLRRHHLMRQRRPPINYGSTNN